MSPELEELRLMLHVGQVPARLDSLPGRAARAVGVAAAVGAPLVPALDAARAALEDERELARAVHVATARARAVSGALLVAPVVLLPGLTRLLDLDLLGFYSSPVGVVVGAVGVALLAVGAALVRTATARSGSRGSGPGPALAAGVVTALVVDVIPGLLVAACVLLWRRRTDVETGPLDGAEEAADLVATALRGGLGAGAALRTAAEYLPDLDAPLRRLAVGLDLARPGTPPPGLERIGEVLTAAQRLGAPAAPALRALAADMRREALTEALAAAERLPVTLTFPMTLCLLPGTLLLVGAPLIHSGLAAAGL